MVNSSKIEQVHDLAFNFQEPLTFYNFLCSVELQNVLT
jgi:hypothetical protein